QDARGSGTLADAGITSQRLSEWREMRDAGEPVIEKAIQEALDQGRAPTKAGIKRKVRKVTRFPDLAQEEPIRDAASVDLMIRLDICRVQDFANFCREHEIRVFVHRISGLQRADFKEDIATIKNWIDTAQDMLKSSFS